MCSLFKEIEIVSLYLNRPVWEAHCIALDTDVCDFILFKSFSFSLFSSTKGYSSITILKLFSELCVFATTVQCVFVLECCMNSFGNLEANYIKSSLPFLRRCKYIHYRASAQQQTNKIDASLSKLCTAAMLSNILFFVCSHCERREIVTKNLVVNFFSGKEAITRHFCL